MKITKLLMMLLLSPGLIANNEKFGYSSLIESNKLPYLRFTPLDKCQMSPMDELVLLIVGPRAKIVTLPSLESSTDPVDELVKLVARSGGYKAKPELVYSRFRDDHNMVKTIKFGFTLDEGDLKGTAKTSLIIANEVYSSAKTGARLGLNVVRTGIEQVITGIAVGLYEIGIFDLIILDEMYGQFFQIILYFFMMLP